MQTEKYQNYIQHALICFLFIVFFACNSAPKNSNGICENDENIENSVRDCFLDTIYMLKNSGGRVDWLKTSPHLIAFDKKNGNYYDVYTMDKIGANVTCLTCNHTALVPKHNGNPCWHPSGNYIVFVGEKANHSGSSKFSTPGLGTHCDLWIISADGSKLYPLTNLPDDENYGVLHPHFNQSGTKLSWSQMYEKATGLKEYAFGKWKLMIADFAIVNDTPQLSSIQTFIPGTEGFYENHGFSPDGLHLLFTGNMNTGESPLTGNKLHLLDIATQNTTQLTTDRYNEHATFIPGYSKIMYATNVGNVNGLDYWIMNTDGSNKVRLTYFNGYGYEESANGARWTVDMSWNSDASCCVFYLQHNLGSQEGGVYMLKTK